MKKLKLSLAVFSFLTFVIFPLNVGCTYLETQVNKSTNSYCNLNVIPFGYEINIGPMRNTSDPVRVRAWTKISVKISKLNCNANDSDFVQVKYIKLDTRNCQLDTRAVNLTNLVNGENKKLSLTNHLLTNDRVHDFVNTELFIILHENISIGDHLLLHIPYEIEMTREYSEKSWQGLYYYDNRGFNGTKIWELYEYYPLHSKYMFPVIDYFDPVHKPTFKISLARHASEGFISVANSEIAEVKEIDGMEDGWVMDHFRESPPMKEDQVTAMILRDFQNFTVQNTNVLGSRNCTINLWTLKNTTFENSSIVLSIQEIQTLFDYYRETFNATVYPMNQIDFVALPWWVGDSNSLSNLGIVGAGDYQLLLDKGDLDADADALKRVSRFLAFQIAEQRFHGMITSVLPSTPELSGFYNEDVWITDKGLANYVAKWPMQNLYQEGVRMRHYHTNTGSELLLMMETVFSPMIIRSAIVNYYLPKTLRTGAFPNDLYNAIELAIEFHNMTHVLPSEINVTVADIFHSWLNNKFYCPNIQVSEVLNDTNSVKIYQEHMGIEGPRHLWWVPIKIMTNNSESILWLSPNNTSANMSNLWTSLDGIDTRTDWLVVNPEGKAFYNIKYSERLLNNIINQLQLNHSVFSPDGRNYLLKNQYDFHDLNNWETVWPSLELSKYLGNETDYHVWETVIGFMSIYDFVDQPNSFTKYFGSRMNDVLGKIEMTPTSQEDINISKLRTLLMKLCAKAEITTCIQYSRELMKTWIQNSTVNPFHSEAYPKPLYCAVFLNESEDLTEHTVFNFVLNQLVNTAVLGATDKGYDPHLCGALACVKNDDLLRALLSNNSKLLGSEILLECYKDTLPDEILLNHRFSMTEVVYDFWMRLTLEGNMMPASLLRRLWHLVPNMGDVSPGFLNKILEFFNNHKDLFDEYLVETVSTMKTEFMKPIYSEKFWSYNIERMNKWIEENM